MWREINISSEVYSAPSQISVVKLFTKIVNDLSPLTVFAKKFYYKCDALRNFVSFLQFKNVKNNHGGVSLQVKLQSSA